MKSYHPLYNAYVCMKQRCFNPNNPSYKHYGGRGISVCQSWRDDFDNFLADMGPRPSPRHSIDRIDNDGNYEPGNCRWADKKTQRVNGRGRRRLITFQGETLRKYEWAERAGMSQQAFDARLAHGWSVERAITTPLRFRTRFPRTTNAVRRSFTRPSTLRPAPPQGDVTTHGVVAASADAALGCRRDGPIGAGL